MARKTFSFYRTDTGEFIAKRATVPNGVDITPNVPDGCAAIEGSYDRLAQKVDIATGSVVPIDTPQE